MFSFADPAVEVAPGAVSGDAGGVRSLGEDQPDVVRTVGVEAGSDVEHGLPFGAGDEPLDGFGDALVGGGELVGHGDDSLGAVPGEAGLSGKGSAGR